MTGGQGEGDEVLGSAEFYDIATQQWTMVRCMKVSMKLLPQVSSLKVPRTEHVMSLIYGVPTIIGS